jgi:hypothetical protein
VCEGRDAAHWTLNRSKIPRTNKTVTIQEAVASIQCQCGRVSCGNVAFCMCTKVSKTRDFSATARRSLSWSSASTSEVSATTTRDSSCADNTGKLSGTYTAGASMLARATPCSYGSDLISPEVIAQRVALWMRPAPESVRVCVTHALSRGHLKVTCC